MADRHPRCRPIGRVPVGSPDPGIPGTPEPAQALSEPVCGCDVRGEAMIRLCGAAQVIDDVAVRTRRVTDHVLAELAIDLQMLAELIGGDPRLLDAASYLVHGCPVRTAGLALRPCQGSKRETRGPVT